MLVISLFSGIGGFELAAEQVGWKPVVSCEINPFGRRVLEYYWPDAYHHDDIKTLTYETINTELSKRFGINWRNDDIIVTGGFPCQPYSLAGKREGKNDARHLWPEMLRLIREIAPTYIVGENVYGIVNWNEGMVFDEVHNDLEASGYEVVSTILPACSVNAHHERKRTWFVAYSSHMQLQGSKLNGSIKSTWEIETNSRQSGRPVCGEWSKFPTQSPVCNGDDGISGRLVGITFPKWRNESIKAMGNTVVPPLVLQIFKTIEETRYEHPI